MLHMKRFLHFKKLYKSFFNVTSCYFAWSLITTLIDDVNIAKQLI